MPEATAEQATTTPTANLVPVPAPRTDGVWVEDDPRTLKDGSQVLYWRVVWRDLTSNGTARKRTTSKAYLGRVDKRPAGFDKAVQVIFNEAFQRGYLPNAGGLRGVLVPHAVALAEATNARVAAAGTPGEEAAVAHLAQTLAAGIAAGATWLPAPAPTTVPETEDSTATSTTISAADAA